MNASRKSLWQTGQAATGALLLLLGASCIASNVVAPEQRMIEEPLLERVFTNASTMQLEGLFESADIQGAAALSLRKIYYLFSADGTYTAAALSEANGKYAFQTLNGTWRNENEGLVLDDGDPVLLERSDDYLRLSAPGGIVILQRRELQ